MSKHKAHWVAAFFALAAWGLWLCPPAEAQAVEAAAPVNSGYLVGTGDVLSVTVYRAPDYSGVVEVGEDGSIAISPIGKVAVGGLTPSSIGDKVAARLRDAGIFRDPVVNVLVQTYRSRTVSVFGNVLKAGVYPLDLSHIRVSEMLAQSGAVLGTGGGTIQLIHGDGSKETIPAAQMLAGSEDPELLPHDTVIVDQAANFYISGEVMKAGSYSVEPDLTIARAIAIAGGLTTRGAGSHVKITRHEGTAERTFKAKASEAVVARDLIVVGARVF